MRWFKFNENMSSCDYDRYCEEDYTEQFTVLQCMKKLLESSSGEITQTAIVAAGQQCLDSVKTSTVEILFSNLLKSEFL